MLKILKKKVEVQLIQKFPKKKDICVVRLV